MSNPTGSQPEPSANKESSVVCCNPLQCRCGSYRFPQRIILALMLHLCLQNNFNARVVLNVAIVEMVGPSAEDDANYTIACPEFGVPQHTEKGGKFPWPAQTKSLVLYAFYIGYTVTQVPGGWLSDKFGGRYILIGCVVMNTICTALFPIAVQQGGYLAAVALRFMIGIAQGPAMPTLSSMISLWFPQDERAMWGGISFAGTNLGTIMGNILTGVLIHAFNGWPIAFYFWSAYSAFYLVLALLFVYSFPDTHPFISEEELTYIKMKHQLHGQVTKRALKTPWKEILTNAPYWANISAQFGHNYIYFTLVTYLPTYMRDILQFDVQSDGLYAAIPFMFLWVTALVFGFTARNFFLKCMSQSFFDKFFGAGCNVASACIVLGAIYAECNRVLCLVLYNISMIVKAFYYVTLTVNINALTKNHGGTMFGLCNAVGSLSGIIGNQIVGMLTKSKQISGWKMAFWVTLGIEVFTTLIFVFFSSDKRQKFDYDESEEQPEN